MLAGAQYNLGQREGSYHKIGQEMVAARNRIRELEEGCGGLTKDRSELQATVAKQNRELEVFIFLTHF